MWHHIWHWIMDFLGVNNTYDTFSTRMYNFWSGFGANVSMLALAGVVAGIYRHYHRYLRALNPTHIVKTPLKLVHKNQGKR